jgi:hypothetical protein
MSYFLWIEDFASVTGGEDIAHNVLGGIIDPDKLLGDKKVLKRDLKSEGVFIELNFGDGLDFIQAKLADIDYIILDINLPAYLGSEPKNNVLRLLEKWHGYKASDDGIIDENTIIASAKALQEIAGYHLYTELIFNLGFPKENILFCSNHGNDLKSIVEAFDVAKIELPQIHTKEDKEDIQAWVKAHYENPYSRLRRGIIEGCKYLKALPEESYRFKDFIKEFEKQPSTDDLRDYLDILASFLPLRKPEDTSTLYKLFVRTLAHEWEAADPELPGKIRKSNKDDQDVVNLDEKLRNNGRYAFSWILKMTRNWISHNSTAIFNKLTAQDVAYLFICSMRAIFDLGDKPTDYENKLLLLFNKDEDSVQLKNSELSIKEKRIPLIQYYVEYFNENTKSNQVHSILNDLQNAKEKLKAKGDLYFITGLYHAFWFLTSEQWDQKDKALPNNKFPNQVYISRFYTLNCHDYSQSEFLLKFSSHIYARSFSQGANP